MADPTPTTAPIPAADPTQQLLAEAIRQIGRLCEQLSQGATLGPAAAPLPPPTAPLPPSPPPVSNAGPVMAGAITLQAFKGTVTDLTAAEQGTVIDAAEAMLEQVYVHLPLKRAMHAVDPIQRLRLLRQRYTQLSPRGFHDEMIGIFHALRDLHTNYILPSSYHGKTAFLPFLVEEFYETNPVRTRKYIVTRLIPGSPPPQFGPGTEVTHWNGVPFARAVELNADREAGSNLDARLARGLEGLTLRPMALTAPPDEDWVVVRYLANGQPLEHKFGWMVFEPPPSPTGGHVSGSDVPGGDWELAQVLGVDAQTEAVRRARKVLFDPGVLDRERLMAPAVAQAGVDLAVQGGIGPVAAHMGSVRSGLEGMDYKTEAVRRSRKALFYPDAVALEQRMAAAVAATPPSPAPGGLESLGGAGTAAPPGVSLMPDVFSFRTVTVTLNGVRRQLAYIRIATFMVADPNAFVAEFIRISRQLPQSGLIIDVRGNGGGNILAGERLLQVLTPSPIEPERLHFLNSAMTQRLVQAAPGQFQLGRWEPSIAMAIETGETYSQGWPLDPVEDYNRIGQQYQGPVVLIIDALCYSTTDIFAAGFQDHNVGPILGVQSRTGAGGANVWELGLLNYILPVDFALLPKGASFRVSIRRTTRVKDRAGVPLEDLGVVTTNLHDMTRNDVLNGNPDLIQAAAELLPTTVRSLKGAFVPPQSATVQVKAENVTRVDAYDPNGRPVGTADIQNDQATLTLNPRPPAGSGRLQLRGFDITGALVVVGWVDL